MKTQPLYGIQSPDGKIDSDSLGMTAEKAWTLFCWPSLNRSAFERDGFKAVKISARNKHKVGSI